MKSLSTMSPLKNTVRIHLHSVEAVRLWTGTTSDATSQRGFNGMQFCLAKIRHILRAAGLDDPWADYWLLRIEEKRLNVSEQLVSLRQQNDQRKTSLPASMATEECHNASPALFSLSSTLISPPGMRVLYLLLDYDKLVCEVVQAHQFSLLSGGEKRHILWQGASLIRGIYSLAQGFYATGATRQDVVSETALAREAEQRLGPLPAEVLSAKERLQWSPLSQLNQEQ